jgi:CheY-like chemotaxis protein
LARIVGLVADTGGRISDGAVLSREFGIPSVVGTSVATGLIKSGDRVRVDGTTGLVEVIERATGETIPVTTSPPLPEDRPLIAIIDDEPSMRAHLTRICENWGRFRTVVGNDGFDAVAIRFGSPEPDAMILNGRMPGMNGPEALDIIRERELREGRGRLPIGLVTAWLDRELLAEEHGADASHWVPFEIEDMLGLIERLLVIATEGRREAAPNLETDPV